MKLPTVARWGGTAAEASRLPFLPTTPLPECLGAGRRRAVAGVVLIALLFLAAPIRALEVREGVLEILVEDDFESRIARTLYFLRGESGVWRLEFTGKAPVGLRSGMRISLRGEPRGDALLVSSEELAAAALRLEVAAPARRAATRGGSPRPRPRSRFSGSSAEGRGRGSSCATSEDVFPTDAGSASGDGRSTSSAGGLLCSPCRTRRGSFRRRS